MYEHMAFQEKFVLHANLFSTLSASTDVSRCRGARSPIPTPHPNRRLYTRAYSATSSPVNSASRAPLTTQPPPLLQANPPRRHTDLSWCFRVTFLPALLPLPSAGRLYVYTHSRV